MTQNWFGNIFTKLFQNILYLFHIFFGAVSQLLAFLPTIFWHQRHYCCGYHQWSQRHRWTSLPYCLCVLFHGIADPWSLGCRIGKFFFLKLRFLIFPTCRWLQVHLEVQDHSKFFQHFRRQHFRCWGIIFFCTSLIFFWYFLTGWHAGRWCRRIQLLRWWLFGISLSFAFRIYLNIPLQSPRWLGLRELSCYK